MGGFQRGQSQRVSYPISTSATPATVSSVPATMLFPVGLPSQVTWGMTHQFRVADRCPLWCAFRNQAGHRARVEKCQHRTHAPQQRSSFDYLVCGCEQRRWYAATKRLGGLGAHNQSVRPLLAPWNATNVPLHPSAAHSGMPAIRNACSSLSMSCRRRKGARAFDTEIRWVGSIRSAAAQACRASSMRPATA
jgi:hypothetical protein